MTTNNRRAVLNATPLYVPANKCDCPLVALNKHSTGRSPAQRLKPNSTCTSTAIKKSRTNDIIPHDVK
jgi:hypothetical protein